MDCRHQIRDQSAKIYRQDLINTLFTYPYTEIDFVRDDLKALSLNNTAMADKLDIASFENIFGK